MAAALADIGGRTSTAVAGARLAPGPEGTDLAVSLLINSWAVTTPGLQAGLQEAAEAIAARLASRLRRGIQFSATQAPARPPAASARG